MIPHLKKFAPAALLLAATVFAATPLLAAGKFSLEDFMKKYHKAPKGTDPICKKAGDGKASKAELTALLEGYTAMGAMKAPKGDDAAWKQKNAALVAAVKDLQAGKADAGAAYKTAVNCKACHNAHKPD